jgi:hypothetical protein
MALVYLTSTAPPSDPSRPHPYDELERMRASAAADRFKAHALTGDPDEADLILFVENCNTLVHWRELRASPFYPVYRAHREKCFLMTRDDFPLPVLPGIYPSIARRWHSPQRTRSGPYLVQFDNDFLAPDLSFSDTPYLFSFVGKKTTDPVRSRLFELAGPAAYFEDTSPLWPYGDLGAVARAAMQDNYVRVCHRSRFVLCPRGVGTSSIRLFESMRMGRAPVIIADAWVPPAGIDWEAVSIRVPEDDVASLPDRLAARSEEAEAMGRRARRVWEDWFSRAATFHRCVDWCLDIRAARRLPEAVLRLGQLRQLAEPTYRNMALRTLLPGRLNELIRSYRRRRAARPAEA